jgi:hypothetical protein
VTERKDDVQAKPGGFTRRSLIAGSAGVATTVAVTAVAPAAAAAAAAHNETPATLLSNPSTPIDDEPVVAYVHNASRSEVTVISGEVEHTYRDPALAKRLLSAAKRSNAKSRRAK